MRAPATGSRLSLRDKLGFAVGDYGFNIYWQGTATFLYFFHTDVLGISPAWAGFTYFVASVWDALADPLMGVLADRTRSRWGRYRPYVLFGAVPLGVSYVLLYLRPPITGGWLIALTLAVHILFRTLYTVVSIPYCALSARLTVDQRERASLTGYRMVFAQAGGFTVSYFTLDIVNRFGGSRSSSGWLTVACLSGAVATVVLLVCFVATREPKPSSDVVRGDSPGAARERGLPLGVFVRMLTENPPLRSVFVAIIFVLVAITMLMKNLPYFFKYVVGNESQTKLAFAIGGIATVLAVPIWVRVARSASKRAAWLGGSLVAAVGLVLLYFAPTTNVPVILAILALIFAGKSAYGVCFWSMLPDTVEFGQWKTGRRDEAKTFGFAILAQKVAMGANALILGAVLKEIGFVANAEQSARTLVGMKAVMILVPLIGAVAGALVMWRYPIDEQLHARMVREIRAGTHPGQFRG